MKKVLLAILLFCVALPFQVFATSMEDLTKARTEESIRQQWAQAQPTYTGSPYKIEPTYKAPYAAGELHPAFIADGIKMIQFLRYVADVPTTVTVNEQLTSKAQHHAVVLSVNYNPSNPHRPSKPADMSDDFYEHSVLSKAYEVLHYNQPNFSQSAIGFVNDPGQHNESRVGHRTSVLSPIYTSIGFGYAGVDKTYSTFRGEKTTVNNNFDYDYIAWPSKGAFPYELANGSNMWSIQFNPEKYEDVDLYEATVYLTNVEKKKTWTFNKKNYIDDTSKFYANQNLLTFNSSDLQYKMKPYANDTFEVKVTDGAGKTIAQYTTKLFPLENKPASLEITPTKSTFVTNEPIQYTVKTVFLNGEKKVEANKKLQLYSIVSANEIQWRSEKSFAKAGNYPLRLTDHDTYASGDFNVTIVAPKKMAITALSASVKDRKIVGTTEPGQHITVNIHGNTYKATSNSKGVFAIKDKQFKDYKKSVATVTVHDKWNNILAEKKVTFN